MIQKYYWKINEILCPSDDSHLTYEFSDYYVIAPTIKFYTLKNNFKINKSGKKGKKVNNNFQYDSGMNSEFLKISQIKKTLEELLWIRSCLP